MKKIVFIETRKKFNQDELNLSELDCLKGNIISLASTIQYLNFIPCIKKYLEKLGKKVILKRGAYYEAHVLGCNSIAFDARSDTLLLLADGKFHALNNAVFLNKEINIFDLKTLTKISTKQIEKIRLRLKAKQKKFFSLNIIGILTSTKQGQKYLKLEQLKKNLQKLNKQVYLFESDNINLLELENFPTIQLWINTACPGLGIEDSRIINLKDIVEFI